MQGRCAAVVRWWATARSTVTVNQWEARFWTAVACTGIVIPAIRESVPVLFFLSTYALAKGARSTAQAAKMEMMQEEDGGGHTGGR